MKTMNTELWELVEELNMRNFRIRNTKEKFAENLVSEVTFYFEPVKIDIRN